MKKKIFLVLFGLLFFNLNLNAQSNESKKLTIIVKDVNNNPIPGAVILFDNVRQKRWTNSKGIFKVKIINDPKEISAFSPKIGIKKIKYNGKKKIKIIIQKGKNQLLTNNKEIDSKQFWSIYDYLKGNVAGLNISSSNTITIRGYNSVNGNNKDPLFILDNNIISKETFSRIRPNFIKSITILKGPETAFYGARGANGVIIVKRH